MKFTLEIELGNEAMQTGEDVAQAISEVVTRLNFVGLDAANKTIVDANGNTVGKWQVSA